MSSSDDGLDALDMEARRIVCAAYALGALALLALALWREFGG